MRKVPKHIKAKIERMSRLMDALVDLNIEVEAWVEKNAGVSDAFELSSGNRDDRGYAYWNPSEFIKLVELEMSMKD